ncbi:MAG: class IV adenylate cyclase [Ktedonobacteraceae bacterium]
MQNLELKVRCESAEHLKSVEALARKHGAIYQYTVEQRDTYFRVSRGRLKLRERRLKEQDEIKPADAELIYYNRPGKKGSRISIYDVMPVSEPELLHSMLTKALRDILVIVEKERILYIYKNTRIHLDTVKMLGTFVELETVIDEAMSMEDVKTEHQAVITFLGLDVLLSVPSSYSDLLIRDGRGI